MIRSRKGFVIFIVTLIFSFIFIGEVNALSVGVTVEGEYYYSSVEKIGEMVNVEREKMGYDPLVLDEKLTEIAMLRAREIAVYYDHTRPNGESCFSTLNVPYTVAGENIAAGYFDEESVMNGWMESLTHKENILNEEFKAIGVGSFYIHGTYYWVQVFTDYVSEEFVFQQNISKADKVIVDEEHLGNFSITNYSDVLNVDIHGILVPEEVILDNLETVYHNVFILTSDLSWNSSNENVFTVDSNGKITPVGIGNAVLTVSLGNKKQEFTVQVTGEVENDITDIEVSSEDIILVEGQSEVVDATPFPEDTNLDKTLTWTSLDENIASVSDQGKITGNSVGNTDVIVTASNGVYKEIHVNVFKRPIYDIQLTNESVVLNLGEDTKLSATVTEDGVLVNQPIDWSSTDQSIVTVDHKGFVSAVSTGKTKVIATYYDVYSDTYISKSVSVVVMVDSVIIKNYTTQLFMGESMKLDLRMLSNRDAIRYTFRSSDSSIATVDEFGNVKGIRTGKVKIEITSSNGVWTYYELDITDPKGGDVYEDVRPVSVVPVTSVVTVERKNNSNQTGNQSTNDIKNSNDQNKDINTSTEENKNSNDSSDTKKSGTKSQDSKEKSSKDKNTSEKDKDTVKDSNGEKDFTFKDVKEKFDKVISWLDEMKGYLLMVLVFVIAIAAVKRIKNY